MKLRVETWGDDLFVRIPDPLAVQAGLVKGAEVEMLVCVTELSIGPSRPRLRLANLLERITPDNIHGEINFGPPMGDEAW